MALAQNEELFKGLGIESIPLTPAGQKQILEVRVGPAYVVPNLRESVEHMGICNRERPEVFMQLQSDEQADCRAR
jgi:hypothetical protein